MHRQPLKDARYRTIGYVDTVTDDKQTGRDARFHIHPARKST